MTDRQPAIHPTWKNLWYWTYVVHGSILIHNTVILDETRRVANIEVSR